MTGYMYKLASTGRADNLKTILEMASNEHSHKVEHEEVNEKLNGIRSSNRIIAIDTILRRLGL